MNKKLRLILIASIIITAILGFAFPNPHPHIQFHGIFTSNVIFVSILDSIVASTFDIFFGFTGCVLIIIVSKWLGHKWLMKDEEYYD